MERQEPPLCDEGGDHSARHHNANKNQVLDLVNDTGIQAEEDPIEVLRSGDKLGGVHPRREQVPADEDDLDSFRADQRELLLIEIYLPMEVGGKEDMHIFLQIFYNCSLEISKFHSIKIGYNEMGIR
jgi:hypothetical protein